MPNVLRRKRKTLVGELRRENGEVRGWERDRAGLGRRGPPANAHTCDGVDAGESLMFQNTTGLVKERSGRGSGFGLGRNWTDFIWVSGCSSRFLLRVYFISFTSIQRLRSDERDVSCWVFMPVDIDR